MLIYQASMLISQAPMFISLQPSLISKLETRASSLTIKKENVFNSFSEFKQNCIFCTHFQSHRFSPCIFTSWWRPLSYFYFILLTAAPNSAQAAHTHPSSLILITCPHWTFKTLLCMLLIHLIFSTGFPWLSGQKSKLLSVAGTALHNIVPFVTCCLTLRPRQTQVVPVPFTHAASAAGNAPPSFSNLLSLACRSCIPGNSSWTLRLD